MEAYDTPLPPHSSKPAFILTPQPPAILQKSQSTQQEGKLQMSPNEEESEEKSKQGEKKERVKSMLTSELLGNLKSIDISRAEEEAKINSTLTDIKCKISEREQKLTQLETLVQQIQLQQSELRNEITSLKNEQAVLKLRKEAHMHSNQTVDGRDLEDYFLGTLLDSLPWENAKQYKYNKSTDTWETKQIKIKLDSDVCSYGEQRNVFRCVVKDVPIKFLAKCTVHDNVSNSIYFEDVKVQTTARKYAKLFNLHNPPQKINFVKAWAVELFERPGKPMYGIEQYLEGEFIKHNSNTGFVHEDSQSTAQAFSHFSYQESGCEILIVDIQGVGYSYTDPQIHSCTGEGYGMGNNGETGIAHFFRTHECNEVFQFVFLLRDPCGPHTLSRFASFCNWTQSGKLNIY